MMLMPKPLTFDNRWAQGVFETDGTISGTLKMEQPKLYISVSNKDKLNLSMLKDLIYDLISFSLEI